MRPALVLAGAGAAAAVLLTVAAIVRVAADPEIRDCAAATKAVAAANSTHQDALRALERAALLMRRDGPQPAEAAQQRADHTKVELDAAWVDYAQLCHQPIPTINTHPEGDPDA